MIERFGYEKIFVGRIIHLLREVVPGKFLDKTLDLTEQQE